MDIQFLLVFLAWLVIILVLLGNEFGFAAIIVTFVACGFTQLFQRIDVLGTIQSHRFELLLWALGYLIAGAVFGVWKWYRFLLQQKEFYKADRMRWLQGCRGIKDATLETAIPKESIKEWAEYANARYNNVRGVNILAANYVAMLVRWTTWWWAIIIVDIIDSFFHNIFLAIYRYLATTYQRIADYVFADIKSDFENQ